MEREQLLNIIKFNEENAREIQMDCNLFYEMMGRSSAVVLSDIQTISRVLFENAGYKLIRLPLKNKEIGAFLLKLNNAKYVVLNTSKSCANNNFALGHELYHTLIQRNEEYNSAEVYMENYEDNPIEKKANAFSGSILMPKEDFIVTSKLVTGMNSDDITRIHEYANDLLTVLTLVNNYKTTYMSVLIRCYECGLFDIKDVKKMDFLLKHNKEKEIGTIFRLVSTRIPVSVQMEPSYIDDFQMLYEEAKQEGEHSLKLGWITKDDLEYRLNGLKAAYQEVVEVQQID